MAKHFFSQINLPPQKKNQKIVISTFTLNEASKIEVDKFIFRCACVYVCTNANYKYGSMLTEKISSH